MMEMSFLRKVAGLCLREGEVRLESKQVRWFGDVIRLRMPPG